MQVDIDTRVWSLGREDPLENDMGKPLQYSCLENPTDGGAWEDTVHKVANSDLAHAAHPQMDTDILWSSIG